MKFTEREMLDSILTVRSSLAVEVLSAENYDNYRTETMPSSSTIEKYLKPKLGPWTQIRDFAERYYDNSIPLKLSIFRYKVLKAIGR